MSIGAHSFTDSGTTNSENFEPPQRTPDATCELVTTPEQAHMYTNYLEPHWTGATRYQVNSPLVASLAGKRLAAGPS